MIEKRKGLIYKIADAYSRSYEDQEDLVQEIILQLWSSFGKYDPKFKITTWIYRIALNVSITHYRKDVVRKKYTIPMTEQFIESSYTEKDNQADDIRQLKKFIQELDEMNRALMILYLDGNSHQEISNVLNISVSNAGTKISRIKEKLREKFKK
jgi:RNA polymerase sigma-70 factor (ECF subfamily)